MKVTNLWVSFFFDSRPHHDRGLEDLLDELSHSGDRNARQFRIVLI